MKLSETSWRDRWQLLNSLLLCLVGALMLGRYVSGSFPSLLAGLGIVFMAFGGYRLALARKEMRKRGGLR